MSDKKGIRTRYFQELLEAVMSDCEGEINGGYEELERTHKEKELANLQEWLESAMVEREIDLDERYEDLQEAYKGAEMRRLRRLFGAMIADCEEEVDERNEELELLRTEKEKEIVELAVALREAEEDATSEHEAVLSLRRECNALKRAAAGDDGLHWRQDDPVYQDPSEAETARAASPRAYFDGLRWHRYCNDEAETVRGKEAFSTHFPTIELPGEEAGDGKAPLYLLFGAGWGEETYLYAIRRLQFRVVEEGDEEIKFLEIEYSLPADGTSRISYRCQLAHWKIADGVVWAR